MTLPRKALAGRLVGWLSQRRFPTLLGITGALFVADLVIPDVIPLVDELLLGLGTAVLARWKTDRPSEASGPQ